MGKEQYVRMCIGLLIGCMAGLVILGSFWDKPLPAIWAAILVFSYTLVLGVPLGAILADGDYPWTWNTTARMVISYITAFGILYIVSLISNLFDFTLLNAPGLVFVGQMLAGIFFNGLAREWIPAKQTEKQTE